VGAALEAPFGAARGGEGSAPLRADFAAAGVVVVVVTVVTPPTGVATLLSDGTEGAWAGRVGPPPETLGALTFTEGALLGVVLVGGAGAMAGAGVLAETVGVATGTDGLVTVGLFTGTLGVVTVTLGVFTVTVGVFTVTAGISTRSGGNPMEAAGETSHVATSSPTRRARHVPVRALRKVDKRAIRNS
jgi:hypothetical protein